MQVAARSLGVERAAQIALIQEMWAEVVGREAGAHSRPMGLRGSVLLVETDAGLWVQELTAQRTRFAEEINRRLGVPVVEDIRFQHNSTALPRGGPGPAAVADSGGPALTQQEMAAIERTVQDISDPALQEVARRAMISEKKWRKQQMR